MFDAILHRLGVILHGCSMLYFIGSMLYYIYSMLYYINSMLYYINSMLYYIDSVLYCIGAWCYITLRWPVPGNFHTIFMSLPCHFRVPYYFHNNSTLFPQYFPSFTLFPRLFRTNSSNHTISLIFPLAFPWYFHPASIVFPDFQPKMNSHALLDGRIWVSHIAFLVGWRSCYC